MVLEKEIFEEFIDNPRDLYKIEKSIKLNLKDYSDEKHVEIVKILTSENESIIVLSNTLTYQSHVPYQSLLIPMRVRYILYNICRQSYLE